MHLPCDLEVLDPSTIIVIMQALPDSLEPILDVLGLPLTLILVEGFAGQQIEFPKSQHGPGAAKFATIASVIGEHAAAAMAKEFGGESVYIPKCDHLRRVWRKFEMTRDYDALLKVTSAAHAVRELCKRHGLSHRQVEDIVNGKTSPKKPAGLRHPKRTDSARSVLKPTPSIP